MRVEKTVELHRQDGNAVVLSDLGQEQNFVALKIKLCMGDKAQLGRLDDKVLKDYF